MHELMTPFKVTDFYWNVRLAKICLPDANGHTHVRLLNSRRLLKYIVEGGGMKRRKELEADNPDIFCTKEFTKQVLMDIDKRSSRKDLVFFPGLVAMSYARLDLENPEADKAQLLELAPVIEWLMSERALLMKRSKGDFKTFGQIDEPDAPSLCEFAVFIDCMSMQSLKAGECSPEHALDFEAVRYSMSVIYAHALTMQLKLTGTPGGSAEKTYKRRGWCMVEDQLARLVKRPEYRLDISEWQHRSQRFGATASDQFGTAAGAEKTVEQLAEQGDCYAVQHAQTLSSMKDTAQVPPMSHGDLETSLQGLTFGEAGDLEACSNMYRGCAQCLLGEKTQIELHDLDYEEQDWRHLGNLLECCGKLATLVFRRMHLTEDKTRILFASLARSHVALPALTSLSIAHNAIGGGVEALAAAIDHGAFPVLETLNLCNCRVDSKGFKLLMDCVADGKLSRLTSLDLSSNPLGDGVECVSQLTSGALPNLVQLHLYGCNIADDGCFALIQALGAGAMPKLTQTEHKDQPGHIDIFRRRNSVGDRRRSLSPMGRNVSADRRRSLSPMGRKASCGTAGSGPGPWRMASSSSASPSQRERRPSLGRQNSIGMLVGQNLDLTQEAREALNAVLADRSRGPALLKQQQERKAAMAADEAEALLQLEQGIIQEESFGRGRTERVGSACCAIC